MKTKRLPNVTKPVGLPEKASLEGCIYGFLRPYDVPMTDD